MTTTTTMKSKHNMTVWGNYAHLEQGLCITSSTCEIYRPTCMLDVAVANSLFLATNMGIKESKN